MKVSPRRAELAADQIATAARAVAPGTRLGSRDDLRALCGVSVGTLHEALRLLQATGEVTVRPGPGGGVFAGERSALSGMLRELHRRVPDAEADFAPVARVLDALAPLVVEDATASRDAAGRRRLAEGRDALMAARDGDLRAFVRATLEVFATVVSLSPDTLLPMMASALLRSQIAALGDVAGPIDPRWRDLVEEHAAAVGRMVDAILAGDAAAAIAARRDPRFLALFAAILARPAA